MSKREPSVLLDDIRTSIEKIQRYTAGLDEGSFLADEKRVTRGEVTILASEHSSNRGRRFGVPLGRFERV